MRTFLLVFNANQISRRSVIERIDSLKAIIDWVAFFDNSLCIVGAISASELSGMLREAMPDVQFIVSELEAGKRNGWLPKSVWEFLKQPRDSDVSAAAE